MSGNDLLNPNNLTYGRLRKIEWLITNATAISPPARAESAIFWLSLGFFCQFRPLLWLGRHFVIWKPPLEV